MFGKYIGRVFSGQCVRIAVGIKMGGVTWTGTSSGRSGIWIGYDGFVIATIHCQSGAGGADDLKRFTTELAEMPVTTPK